MSALAKRTGISRRHLYCIFSNEGNPSLDSLIKIADALGYSLELIPK